MSIDRPAAGTSQHPTPQHPIRRTRTHELVIEAIEEQIITGSLRVGDPLAPERDLATQLGVSRPAVREAIRVLEAQGVIRSGVGSGADAGTFVAAMPAQALSRFLRLHLALSNFGFGDLVEARVALERSSVVLACTAPGAADLGKARAAVEVMEQAGADRAAYGEADADFHIALAEASGNRLVTALTVAIRNAQRADLVTAFAAVEDWPALRDALTAEHHGILDAIAAGDAARAATLAEAHIRDSYARLPALHAAHT